MILRSLDLKEVDFTKSYLTFRYKYLLKKYDCLLFQLTYSIAPIILVGNDGIKK